MVTAAITGTSTDITGTGNRWLAIVFPLPDETIYIPENFATAS
jgi:hypothetical protein